MALPSPLAVASRTRASIACSAGASSPRQAASVSEAYLTGAFPVASMIAPASSISAAAAANSPAFRCTLARFSSTMGRTLSAPASRASETARVASSCRVSSSHRSAATMMACQTQGWVPRSTPSSLRPASRRNACSARRSGGTPAA
jgi:hypothetical protein